MTADTDLVPCKGCGVGTDQHIEWYQPRAAIPGAPPGRAYQRGVCPSCQTLDFTTPGYAVRAALRVAGLDESKWEAAAEVFEAKGLDPVPVLHVGGQEGEKPWSHVPKDLVKQVKAAWLDVLLDRVYAAATEDRPVAPPSGEACLACGVAQSTGWAAITVTLPRGAGSASGHYCAACTAVRNEVGASGAVFLETALARSRGEKYDGTYDTVGLTYHIATGLPPTTEPFGWIEVTAPVEAVEDDAMSLLFSAIMTLGARLDALEARLANTGGEA